MRLNLKSGRDSNSNKSQGNKRGALSNVSSPAYPMGNLSPDSRNKILHRQISGTKSGEQSHEPLDDKGTLVNNI